MLDKSDDEDTIQETEQDSDQETPVADDDDDTVRRTSMATCAFILVF